MPSVRTNRIRDAADFAAVFGVSRETLARLETYERLLRTWQKTINLVAPSTLDEVWHRHFADSAQVVGVADSLSPSLRGEDRAQPKRRAGPAEGEGQPVALSVQLAGGAPVAAPHSSPLPLKEGERESPARLTWTDLGTGAGFPGLVVAILLAERGQARVTLVDSDQRKAAFCREVVRETGLKASITVDIVVDRIEAPANRSKAAPVHVVSARALAPLPKLLEWAQPYFGSETVGVFLKGREAAAEIETAEALDGWSFDLRPSLTDAEASVVVVRRV